MFEKEKVQQYLTSDQSNEWFRHTFPAILNLYNYSQKDDENRKNFILSEACHYLPYNVFENNESIDFTKNLLKIKAKWWFENFKPFQSH